SAEVYLKKIHNIAEYKQSADIIGSQHIEQDILHGKLDAYGIEFMLEKETGKLNGWISYTFSRSEITVDGAFPWQRINGGESYPTNYDKPHALNLVMNYRVNRRLSLSGNVVYTTGRPVTYPVSSYYLRGQEIVNYSQRNTYRLPDYFRIDLSLNLEGNLKARKNIHSYWMVNIYNLTGRKNAYSVYFRSEEGQLNSYRLAIFGTAIVSLSWNFKFGNYASQ
ncbi:MAG: TonB-dependent receptor, partial [Bacteroidetes bacterium]